MRRDLTYVRLRFLSITQVLQMKLLEGTILGANNQMDQRPRSASRCGKCSLEVLRDAMREECQIQLDDN